jgi:hypothetical protein
MIVWILTILDFFVMLIILFAQLDIFHYWRFFIFGAAYMIGKGFLFRGDFFSVIDIGIGIYLLIMLLGAHWFISWIILVWLAYKVMVPFFYR